jgi:hypothetical protein
VKVWTVAIDSAPSQPAGNFPGRLALLPPRAGLACKRRAAQAGLDLGRSTKEFGEKRRCKSTLRFHDLVPWLAGQSAQVAGGSANKPMVHHWPTWAWRLAESIYTEVAALASAISSRNVMPVANRSRVRLAPRYPGNRKGSSVIVSPVTQ